MDALTARFAPRSVSKSRWSLIIAFVLVAYLWFHGNRSSIENELVRGSFPSFLVPILMLGVTELDSSIVYHSVTKKLIITLIASLGMAIWFEGLVPLFWLGSTASFCDIFAILLGWMTYTLLWVVQRYMEAVEMISSDLTS